MKNRPTLFDKQINNKHNRSIDSFIEKTERAALRNTIFVHRDKLHVDPENAKKYPQENIEELMELIKLRKMLYSDLYIRRIDNTDEFQIVAGERRYHAICLLSKEDYEEIFPKGVNCLLAPSGVDPDLLKLDQILENYTQRHKTVYLMRAEILDLNKQLTILEDKGIIEESVLSKMLSLLDIQKTQLYKYLRTANLIPEFDEMLENDSISLNEVASIATLNEDEQRYIYEKKVSGIELSDSEFAYIKNQQEVDDIQEAIDSLEEEKQIYEKNLSEAKSKQEALSSSKNVDLKNRQESKVKTAQKKLDKADASIKHLTEEKEKLVESADKLKHSIELQNSFPEYSDIDNLLVSLNTDVSKLSSYKEHIKGDNALHNRLHDIIDLANSILS